MMKTIINLSCVLTAILSLSVIPISLFLINIPLWIPIILSIIIAVMFILSVIKTDSKKLTKIMLGISSAVCILTLIFASTCLPYWNSYFFKNGDMTKDYTEILSYEDAKEDLNEMLGLLKKTHPKFLKGSTEEIDGLYNKALLNLKNAEKIDVAMLKREIQGILTSLNDAHTCCYALTANTHYLKYAYQIRDEKLTVTAIDGIKLSEFLTNYSYEVESWGAYMLSNDIITSEGLYFLGIDLSDGVDYTYQDENGNEIIRKYKKEDFVTIDEFFKFNNKTKEEKPFVYYEIDVNKNIATLTLNECNYNDEYRKCLNEMFAEIKEKGIENVVVDLRNNNGGDSRVANEFIKYLNVEQYLIDTFKMRLGCFELIEDDGLMKNTKVDDLMFNGKVFVLTSESTFSSAMLFAQYFKDNKLGQIIGEIPGNAANGYGDITIFRLKNSGLYMQISTKEFVRANKTDEILVIPDYECEAEECMTVVESLCIA